jgi:hypothetical protein
MIQLNGGLKSRKKPQGRHIMTHEANHEWSWWRSKLAGEQPPLAPDEIHRGFYRILSRDKTRWQAVAFFREGDEWVAMVDDGYVKPDRIPGLFLTASKNPIPFALYDAVVNKGEPWPDEPPPLAPRDHNLPSDADPLDRLTAEFEGEREFVERFLREPIADQAAADTAGIWAKRLLDIAKRATEHFTVEKRPILDEAKRVDDKWRSIRDQPQALATRLKRHVDGWLIARQRAERERVEAARREALRLQQEAAEKARAADEARDPDALVSAGAAVAAAQDAARQAEYQRPQAGRTGAKVSLRTFRRGEITDYPKFLVAVAEQPEIKDAAQTVADRFARNRIKADGMEVVEEQRAV